MLTQCQPSRHPFIRTFVIYSLRLLIVLLVTLIGLAWLTAPVARAYDQPSFQLIRTLGNNNYLFDSFNHRIAIFSQYRHPTIAISPISIMAGNVDNGSRNHLLGGLSLTVSTAHATLTGVTVPLTGTYTTADVDALKLWFSSNPSFNAEQDILLSTLTAPGAAGNKRFPVFSPHTIPQSTTIYLFITADIASNARHNNTIALAPIPFQNIVMYSPYTYTGTDPVAASGVQTIFDITAPMATLEQSSEQTDPTHTMPVLFTLTFSETVIGVTADDVHVRGLSRTAQVTVTEIAPMDGTTYQIGVSGMQDRETVEVTVPAGAATNAVGVPSRAATCRDNRVTYESANLFVTKELSERQLAPGATVVYTLTYGNRGSFQASSVCLTDTLPSELTFVTAKSMRSSSASLTTTVRHEPQGQTLVWSQAELWPGAAELWPSAMGRVFVWATVSPSVTLGTLITNQASISTTSPETNYDNNHVSYTAAVTAVQPPLYLGTMIEAQEPAWAGGPLTYYLRYWNTSSHIVTGGVISSTVPMSTTFVSASDGGRYSNGSVTWDMPVFLPSSGFVSMTVDVAPQTSLGALLVSTAGIAASDIKVPPVANTTTVTTTVQAPPGAVSGTIFDPWGTPVSRAWVRLYRQEVGAWVMRGWARTDEQGKYTITNLPVGTYGILIADSQNRYPHTTNGITDTLYGASDLVVTSGAHLRGVNRSFGHPHPPLATSTMSHGWVFTDPRTGQIAIHKFVAEQRSDVVITTTHESLCPAASAPISVVLRLSADWGMRTELPMVRVAPPVSDTVYGSISYRTTIPAAHLIDGTLYVVTTCPDQQQQTIQIGTMQMHNPLGIITDARTSLPVADAEVTLFKLPDWPDEVMDYRRVWNDKEPAPTGLGIPGDPAAGSPKIVPPMNPLLTDVDGRYGWNVFPDSLFTATWYVVVAAPGYETRVSPFLDRPYTVNLSLVPEDAATVQISHRSMIVAEAAGTAEVVVTRRNAKGATSVGYTTTSGGWQATSGMDYIPIDVGTLQFAPGEISKTIAISITNDTTVEDTEAFVLDLSNPQGAVRGTPSSIVIAIADDDSPTPVAVPKNVLFLPFVWHWEAPR